MNSPWTLHPAQQAIEQIRTTAPPSSGTAITVGDFSSSLPSPNTIAHRPFGEGSDEEKSPTVMAVPLDGGAVVRICSIACWAGWSVQGEFMHLNFHQSADQ